MAAKFHYRWKRFFTFPIGYTVFIILFSLLLIIWGISVALYTSQAESRGSLTIVTGNLSSHLESEDFSSDHGLQIGPLETKMITLILENLNEIEAKFNLYYHEVLGVSITVIGGDIPPKEEGMLMKAGEKKIFKLKITNTLNHNQQVTFGSEVGLADEVLEFSSENKILEEGDLNEADETLYHIIKAKSLGTDANIDFTSKVIDSGVYLKQETSEDKYPVYYYRGTVDNNLIFGGFCWKIVRTTETGGIKLIYNGHPTGNQCSSYSETDSLINTALAFNTSYNSLAYVGYMYGDVYSENHKTTASSVYGNDVIWNGSEYILQNIYEGDDLLTITKDHHYTCFSQDNHCKDVYYIYYIDSTNSRYVTLSNGVKIEEALEAMFEPKTDSTIKAEIDTWYKNNMMKYTNKLEDTVWCNDRSIYQANGWSKDGMANEVIFFGGYSRVGEGSKAKDGAILSCPNKRDSFTVSSENGNGALTYPVGLLTADEATFAGSGWQSFSSDSYLYTNTYLRLSTPYSFGNNGYAYTFVLFWAGNLYVYNVSNRYGIRPSISLARGTLVTGEGTTKNPYVVF